MNDKGRYHSSCNTTLHRQPPALFLPEPKASERFWEFFTANIRNKNTRRAYYKAAARFSDWCESRNIYDFKLVKPTHVAAFIEELLQEPSKPTVKQHLVALRMLFDWLVVGQSNLCRSRKRPTPSLNSCD